MKRVAFISNGCQAGFCKPREIIAADCENYREVRDPERADILMVNFCAISAEGVEAFDRLRKQVIEYKMTNPNLKVIAGGCIEGLSEKKDLDFADAVFHHQGEAEVFATVLGKDDAPALAPFIMNGAVQINISQGCNNRCTFCKVHYLENMQLTSRPMEEILDLARRAISGGCKIVSLIAENSTEYGTDIGTSLTDLLQRLLELDGLRLLDVDGVCLDEVTPELLRVLQHPKIRTIQIEAQSLDDQIRKNMGLKKTTAEALEILNVLSGKALISNFMIGFPGHSINEFDREMRKIRNNHLYYLTLDPYDDTPGTPSHKLYKPLNRSTEMYYTAVFMQAVVRERKLLLEQLMREQFIKAAVVSTQDGQVILSASNYAVEIHARRNSIRCRPGDIVHVKITGLYDDIPEPLKLSMFSSGKSDTQIKRLLEDARYFGMGKLQQLPASGEIIELAL